MRSSRIQTYQYGTKTLAQTHRRTGDTLYLLDAQTHSHRLTYTHAHTRFPHNTLRTIGKFIQILVKRTLQGTNLIVSLLITIYTRSNLMCSTTSSNCDYQITYKLKYGYLLDNQLALSPFARCWRTRYHHLQRLPPYWAIHLQSLANKHIVRIGTSPEERNHTIRLRRRKKNQLLIVDLSSKGCHGRCKTSGDDDVGQEKMVEEKQRTKKKQKKRK